MSEKNTPESRAKAPLVNPDLAAAPKKPAAAKTALAKKPETEKAAVKQ